MSDEVELSAQVLIVAVLETLSLIVKITAYHVVWTKYKDVFVNRKNDLILIMTPEKQDKTLELSKHWSADSNRQEIK